MSGIASMIVKIQADTQDLQSKLNQGGAAIQSFANKSNTSLKSVGDGSKQAGQALINVGRVAQDSAFGFIGIANNLNPLLESFQRLKEETGSSGVAMKALGSSLLGAGGVGLALSAVTAILSFSSIGFSAWTRGLNGSSDALENLNLNILKFTENTKDAKSELEGFITDTENALKLFEQSSAQTFGSKFKGQIEGAEAKWVILGEQITEVDGLVKKLSENSGLAFASFIGQATTETKNLAAAFNDNFSKIPEKLLSKLPEDQRDLVNAVIESNKALTEQQNKLKELQDARTLQSSTIRTLEADEKRRLEETAAKAESVTTVLEKLDKQLLSIDVIGAIFGKGGDKVATEKISAITSSIERLVKDFNVSPDDTIIAKLIGNKNNDLFKVSTFLNNINDLELHKSLAENVQQSIDKTGPLEIKVPILPVVDLKPLENNLHLDGDKLNEMFKSIGVNAAEAFSEGLGNLVSGASGIGDFFSGIFKTVGAGLKQLGKYFIETAIKVEIFKKWITANPALALVAGIGLVALGQIIQNQTARKQAFATGGFVYGNGTSTSDSIPAVLSNGEYVLRASAVGRLGTGYLDYINGGGSPTDVGSVGASSVGVPYIMNTVISGNDLRVVLSRANSTYSRNT